MTITQMELKELLDYNPETGVFVWKVRRNNFVKEGSEAGGRTGKGYLHIEYKCKKYKCHRLAWLYVYGAWPEDQVDHINGIKDDNRISNLRVATNRQNQQNQKMHRDGRLQGATYNKMAKRWRAQISHTGSKPKHIGYFDSEQEAHEAYLKEYQKRESPSEDEP